jgi:hypothetical protein
VRATIEVQDGGNAALDSDRWRNVRQIKGFANRAVTNHDELVVLGDFLIDLGVAPTRSRLPNVKKAVEVRDLQLVLRGRADGGEPVSEERVRAAAEIVLTDSDFEMDEDGFVDIPDMKKMTAEEVERLVHYKIISPQKGRDLLLARKRKKNPASNAVGGDEREPWYARHSNPVKGDRAAAHAKSIRAAMGDDALAFAQAEQAASPGAFWDKVVAALKPKTPNPRSEKVSLNSATWIEDPKVTTLLRSLKKPLKRNKGDYNSAVQSAYAYAVSQQKRVYGFLGNSYMHAIWNTTLSFGAASNRINNASGRVFVVDPQGSFSWLEM